MKPPPCTRQRSGATECRDYRRLLNDERHNTLAIIDDKIGSDGKWQARRHRQRSRSSFARPQRTVPGGHSTALVHPPVTGTRASQARQCVRKRRDYESPKVLSVPNHSLRRVLFHSGSAGIQRTVNYAKVCWQFCDETIECSFVIAQNNPNITAAGAARLVNQVCRERSLDQ